MVVPKLGEGELTILYVQVHLGHQPVAGAWRVMATLCVAFAVATCMMKGNEWGLMNVVAPVQSGFNTVRYEQSSQTQRHAATAQCIHILDSWRLSKRAACVGGTPSPCTRRFCRMQRRRHARGPNAADIDVRGSQGSSLSLGTMVNDAAAKAGACLLTGT